MITSVGGHIKSYAPGEWAGFNGDRSLFVAVVPTADAVSFPDLALSRAEFVAVVQAPYNAVGPHPFQVPDTVIPTRFQLPAGDYVILFGSGLFGATGSGWMPIGPYDFATPRYIAGNNLIDFGPPRYILANAHTGPVAFFDMDYQPARFVITGYPLGNPH